MRRRTDKKGFFGSERGLVTVEFVIILPIIFAAMFLVYELGRALLAYEIAGQDIRNATRYLSRVEGADPTLSTDPAVTAAETLARTGDASGTANCPADYPPSASTNCHYPWTSSSTIQVTTTNFTSTNYNADGTVMTMTASIPMTLSLLSFIGVSAAYTLTVSNTAQYIGD